MQVNQINNTTFKQTFMPGYSNYTDIQKKIGNDIESKTASLDVSYNEVPLRPDLLVTRCGKTDSLHVFSCYRNYDYRRMSDFYENRLFVGKYDINHPFQVEDIAKAKSKATVNSIKARVITFIATTKKILKSLI